MPRPARRGSWRFGHTAYVVGNDGSGKTTFTGRLSRKAEALGMRVHKRRYHASLVRVVFRRVVEAWTGASRQKTAQPPGEASGASRPAGGGRRLLLLAFLWIYQTAIGVESRFRDLFDRADLLIVDRSFVDDLVSTAETLRVEVPASLLRYCCLLFPVRRLYFLSAGDAVEFSRIVDVDLSEAFHREKGKRYRGMIATLEPWTPGLRRISTAPRNGNSR